jgi:chemotaxis protein methyltransferase CheR
VTPLDCDYLRKILKDRSDLDLSDRQYPIESRRLPLARPTLADGAPGKTADAAKHAAMAGL